MDLTFTEEEEQLRQRVREFMDRACPAEYVRELDRKGEYPYELYQKWADEGWLAMPFPRKYGGQELSAVKLMILAEGFAVRGYELASAYSSSVFIPGNILRLGTEEQKDYYIPKTMRGELRYGVGFSEPTAGSDAANIKTTAILDGDEFVINGTKIYTTGAHAKNTVIQLAARTIPDAPKHEGISLILVPKDTPGVEVRKMDTLGQHLVTPSRTILSNARVPKANLLGPLHEGWRALLGHHGVARLFISGATVGVSQTVVNMAVEHAKTRVQFDQPIAKFQVIAHRLADMQTQVEAGRWLTYRTASIIDHNLPSLKEVCMAKLYTSEVYHRIATDAIHIFGGIGYTRESDIGRYWLEAQIRTIAGGTSEVQRNVIARQMRL